MTTNAAELLLAGRAGATALIANDDTIGYGALRERVIGAAAGWSARGIAPGDICVVALADGIDWVIAFLSLVWAGAVPALISPKTEPRMIAELLAESHAKLLLAEDPVAQSVGDARALSLSAWLAARAQSPGGRPEPIAVQDTTPAFLLFSSGTTGRPKGVVHAHRCVQHAQAFAQRVLGAHAGDRFYSTSKLFFAYPLANSLFAGLRLGATVILDAQWPSPERVAELSRRHRPTLLFSVPTLYRRLLDAGVGFDAMRRCVSAGEACPRALAEAWQRRHGLELIDGYGTTETLVLMLYKPPEMAGARAAPLAKVREEPAEGGVDSASGVRLWFSHPCVSLGYTREAPHDSARFGADGFSPGDVFRRSDDKEDDGVPSWTYAGRSDQLLKVYGRWVDTLALEHWLIEKMQAEVAELSVVASDDGDAGTRLHLFVVPRTGRETALPERVQQLCGELHHYQRLAETHVVGELPRTETGKVKRGALRESLRQAYAARTEQTG